MPKLHGEPDIGELLADVAIMNNRGAYFRRKEASGARLLKALPFLLAQAEAVQRAIGLCNEYQANCDPTSRQAEVAEFFRAALDGPS